MTRERITEIINKDKHVDKAGTAYDIIMLVAITASIVPLMFTRDYPVFKFIEAVTVTIFIIDYILRWITADKKLGKGGFSFLLYPITPMAVIDMLSILPALALISKGFKVLRITRMVKITRMFKFLRYSDKFEMLCRVLKREKAVLLSVFWIAVFYVFISALIIFNTEPHIDPITGEETFMTFFDALYWATVTLTTVGYGDLCPVTVFGRLFSMLSSLFGVAIIALPSGVITASYLDELRNSRKSKEASTSNEVINN